MAHTITAIEAAPATATSIDGFRYFCSCGYSAAFSVRSMTVNDAFSAWALKATAEERIIEAARINGVVIAVDGDVPLRDLDMRLVRRAKAGATPTDRLLTYSVAYAMAIERLAAADTFWSERLGDFVIVPEA